jgi:drug/metabolite transporter (DMT)-like permease
LVVAAVLWSLGSFFMLVLRKPTSLNLHEPTLSPVQIAFWRSLFAGLCLIPLVRPAAVRLRPLMLLMVACFAIMSGLYLSALGLGNAANAILLQNTAPVWVYLIGVFILGQKHERSAWRPIALAMFGACVIVFGNWPWHLQGQQQTAQIQILGMAMGSGLMYAGVVTFLGLLNREAPAYLMVLNLIGTALLVALTVGLLWGWAELVNWLSAASWQQLGFVALFGLLQMAVPYVLFARSLKVLSSTDAAIITLIEPLLNPVWAYLIDPVNEQPTWWSVLGGALLLLALLWRYLPSTPKVQAPV